MPLQDLTPQLRTRLNRMEKAVGLFVTLATFIMLALLAYYIYHLAEIKGWFLSKVEYKTAVADATGLTAGSPIKLMGKDVGEVTLVELNRPGAYYNLTVYFNVRAPYYGYIWADSKVQVVADMLGHRTLQILKGEIGSGTVWENDQPRLRALNVRLYDNLYEGLLAAETNKPAGAPDRLPHFHDMDKKARSLADEEVKKHWQTFYPFSTSATNAIWIKPDENPDLMARLEQVATMVERAVPGILSLTNLVAGVLTRANSMEEQVTGLLADTRPVVSNLTVITANLKEPRGSLGQWIIPTNTQAQLDVTLDHTDHLLAGTDANLALVVSNLDVTLENLGVITSNLSAQVAANTNMLTRISTMVLDSDTFIQGLKHYWLLRSAFKPAKTNSTRPNPRSAAPKPPR